VGLFGEIGDMEGSWCERVQYFEVQCTLRPPLFDPSLQLGPGDYREMQHIQAGPVGSPKIGIRPPSIGDSSTKLAPK